MGLRRICVFGAGAIGGHLAAIRANGVALREGAGAQATGRFATAAAPLTGADTAFVFVQNGMPWWYARRIADAGSRARG